MEILLTVMILSLFSFWNDHIIDNLANEFINF